MPNLPHLCRLWLQRLTNFTIYFVAIWLILGFSLLLALRMFVMPRIDDYRPDLAAYASRAIGLQVEIGGLTAGWDGWNPMLGLYRLKVFDQQQRLVLELPEVQSVISWRSLLLADLRLRQLAIWRPQLAIRRGKDGTLYIAGIGLEEKSGGGGPMSNWLLNQRQIEIHDALLTWEDQQRGSPQILLDQVNFRLENSGDRHRFGLSAQPPVELAGRLDLRGDLYGDDLNTLQDWEGRTYASLEYADVGAWREWLPMPLELRRGQGAVRFWLQFAAGRISQVTGDLALQDVRLRVESGLPELELDQLAGRVAFSHTERGGKAETRLAFNDLSLTTAGSHRLPPMTLAIRQSLERTQKDGSRPGEGELSLSRIDLDPLRIVADHLPLPLPLREGLAKHQPQGTVEDARVAWKLTLPPGAIANPKPAAEPSGDAAADGSAAGTPPTRRVGGAAMAAGADTPDVVVTAVKGRFSRLGWMARDAVPGVEGLSGSIDATATSGSASFDSTALKLDMRRVFETSLQFATFGAQIAWDSKQRGKGPERDWRLKIAHLNFANNDLAGSVSGEYRSLPEGPGWIDLTGRLTNTVAKSVPRYLPLVVNPDTRQWLQMALQDGMATEAKLKLNGDLREFPFRNPKHGKFEVLAKASNVTLNYAPGWPAITGIDADLIFRDVHMDILSHKAVTSGTRLSKVKVSIADIKAHDNHLLVDGESAGALTDFLRFVEASPVGGWIDHFTQEMTGTGAAHLALKLDIPLAAPNDGKVNGELSFQNNEVKLDGGLPVLNRLNGKLTFTERELKANGLTAEALGGPVTASLSSANGRVRVNATGYANFAELRSLVKTPLLSRVNGHSEWQLTAAVRRNSADVVVESNLRGVEIDLPPPLKKQAGESWPLRVERREEASDRDRITFALGPVGQGQLTRMRAGGQMNFDRGWVQFGANAPLADRPGFWVRGGLKELDLDRWLAVDFGDGKSGGGARPASGDAADKRSEAPEFQLAGLELNVETLHALGKRWSHLRANLHRQGERWLIGLAGQEIQGNVTWLSGAAAGNRSGRLVARLANLAPPPDAAPPGEPVAGTAESDAKPNEWPALDVVAEHYSNKGRELGRLELVAKPQGPDWRLEKLHLTNADGAIHLTGWQRIANDRAAKAVIDAKVEVKDVGQFFARLGLPEGVKGGTAELTGQLQWAGSVTSIDYPSLSGQFRLTASKGQFTKVEPGLAKLLGVLNLQSLPKRITLDFRDVFSEGFLFDEIGGEVKVENGRLTTQDLKIEGSAAKVAISGEADIARETQKLRVRVQPSLSTGVAGAVLLAINPTLGAAAYVGQKVLGDPVEKMFAYDYDVSGTWSDPKVEKAGLAAATAGGGSKNSKER